MVITPLQTREPVRQMSLSALTLITARDPATASASSLNNEMKKEIRSWEMKQRAPWLWKVVGRNPH